MPTTAAAPTEPAPPGRVPDAPGRPAAPGGPGAVRAAALDAAVSAAGGPRARRAGGAGTAGRLVQLPGGATARLHNVVMEEVFTALRTGTGAAAALARGDLPAPGGPAVFRCSVAHGGAAAVVNPSQPTHSLNFYEIVPRLDDGTPLEPGTPLPPGAWRVRWSCPSYPVAHGGPAEGAFHVGVGVDAADLPAPWARNAAGDVAGAPGNVTTPALPRPRLEAALRRLVAVGEQAERDGCDVMAGFVASKARRVRNAHPAVFDRDDALQEGMAKLVVLMRRFAAPGRPRACWSVAAGLVLERDLPRAADRVGHVPSNVAHCAHWLTRTDTVDHRDPGLTPEAAAAAYAADQRRRRRANPRTRTWLNDAGGDHSPFSPEVWRLAIAEARRGRPVSLDALAGAPGADHPGVELADLVPATDRDLELVGARRLVDLLDDLLAGTGLSHEDVHDWLHPRLTRRDYPAEALGGPSRGPDATTPRSARDRAENRLLALVARPGESLTRDRATLRARVRAIMFDDAGRFRPTEERRRLWHEHRAASPLAGR